MATSSRHSLSPPRLAELIANRRVQVVDLRRPVQWAQGHVQGARNIELENLADEAITFDRECPIVFYDANAGSAAAEAAQVLRSAGMTAYALDGGVGAWTAAGQPLQTGG